MFGDGFLGTSAPLYMDVITVYFGLLPFLMAMAVYMAIKKKFDLHFKAQLAIYVMTIMVVVLFEVGVRVSGGFAFFMQESNANYDYMLTFLLAHVLIAFVSVVLYTLVVYSAIREYKLNHKPMLKSHRKFGKLAFFGMTVTSITGVMVYYFLFVY